MMYDEIIRTIMGERKISMAGLSRMCRTSKENVYEKISPVRKHKGINTDTLIDILDLLEYKLMIVPKGTRVPIGGAIVEHSRDDQENF